VQGELRSKIAGKRNIEGVPTFMIIETILSSTSEDGKANFAPIGVRIPDDCLRLSEVKEIDLFLYPGSHTFSNLKQVPQGVANLTDDVLSFVEAALFSDRLATVPSRLVLPPRIAAAKTLWEFSIGSFDDSSSPARVRGKVLLFEEVGGFAGYCRAQGAILEATIAATRLQWILPRKILDSWQLWQEAVAKTGGIREQRAFQKLTEYFVQQGFAIPTGTST
jgi:hypothetical protein